jgi:hypothetical protein
MHMAVFIVAVVVFRRVWLVAEALLAMEDQEVHAEGIEGRDEDTGQHRKLGEPGPRQV